MIVLVVGRQGQLARSLAEAPQPAGMRMIVASRPELDLLQPDSVAHTFDDVSFDVVINAAAYTAVDKAESETELAFAVNSEGPRHLAAACALRGIPLVHVSTDYVYDGTKAEPYVESDPVNPISAYGRSKLAGELNLIEANPRHIILRTAWMHAPYGTNFVRTMLRLGATRPEIGVVDDQHGNPTYAPHLAAAILAVVTEIANLGASNGPWGVYHAVSSGETTWFGMAQEIFRCSEGYGHLSPKLHSITTSDYATPASRPANSRLDTSKLAQTFGVRLPSWRDGIADCVRRLNEAADGRMHEGTGAPRDALTGDG
jgi:dTDP-4-dehydrorhamnose reductase